MTIGKNNLGLPLFYFYKKGFSFNAGGNYFQFEVNGFGFRIRLGAFPPILQYGIEFMFGKNFYPNNYKPRIRFWKLGAAK